MYRSMNLKGFLAIMGVMVLLFLVLHAVLRGAVEQPAGCGRNRSIYYVQRG